MINSLIMANKQFGSHQSLDREGKFKTSSDQAFALVFGGFFTLSPSTASSSVMHGGLG